MHDFVFQLVEQAKRLSEDIMAERIKVHSCLTIILSFTRRKTIKPVFRRGSASLELCICTNDNDK